MTREEEIIIEFEAASNHRYNDDAKSLIISAMEWADEHPRKGLVDIEKACEWLKNCRQEKPRWAWLYTWCY